MDFIYVSLYFISTKNCSFIICNTINLSSLQNMNFTAAFEALCAINPANIFTRLLHSPYFPEFYIVNCLYVCYFLRIVAPIGGLPAMRSFCIGLFLSYSTRFCFGLFTGKHLPELDTDQIITQFTIVWAMMNCFPFDVIFSAVRNIFCRTVLQVLAAYGNAQLMCNIIFNLLNFYPGDCPRAICMTIMVFCVPIFIDYFDSWILGQKRDFIYLGRQRILMLYPFHYIKRIAVFAFLTVMLSQGGWILPVKYTLPIYYLTPIISILMSCCSLLDIIFHKGNPFFMLDLVFPKLFRIFFTFHPKIPFLKAQDISFKIENEEKESQ